MRTSIPGTGSLGWGGGGWYFLQEEGRQGGSGIGPSFNYLPTHGLGPADSMLLASFLTLSSLPPPQKITGKEKLDHLGLWEGLAEKELDSDSTWEP